MVRPPLAAGLLLLLACGRPHEGAARADIEWSLSAERPACVRVAATDVADTARSVAKELPLTGAAGRLHVALARPVGFGPTVEVVASLHVGSCAASVNVADRATVTFQLDRFQLVPLNLVERAVDGGPGLDGGADAGADAGVDAGADAGTDGGADAGPVFCDGGLFVVSDAGAAWRDLVVRSGDVFLVGAAGALATLDRAGVLSSWAGGSCGAGDYSGVYRRPSNGTLYGVTTAGGLMRINAPQSCTVVTGLTPGNFQRAVTGFEQGADLVLFVASARPNERPLLTRFSIVGTSVVYNDLPVGSSNDDIRDVAGTSEAALFAVGWEATGDRGIIYRYDAGTPAWTVSRSFPGNTRLYALDVLDSNTAFAAGDVFVQWDGASWNGWPDPPFRVRGLRALSSTEVWAVGDSSGQLGVARWDGLAWTTLNTFNSSNALARIRGPTRCELWAAGTSNVVTTSP